MITVIWESGSNVKNRITRINEWKKDVAWSK